MRSCWLLVALILTAAPAFAQSEQVLRETFQGKFVRVRIDMPATSAGVEIRPDQKPPVDFVKLGDRMKREGTSLRAGDQVMVTKIRVGKNFLEFQMGGGGYGTFGDMLNSSPSSSADVQGKSGREKNLEDQIRATSDPGKKKSLERELKDERRQRESDNARSEAEANQANQLREANIQRLKLGGGSRFTFRFGDHSVPPEYLTPEGLRHALAEYVEFDEPRESSTEPEEAALTSLRKGLTLAEVERVLGPSSEATEKREGSLVILERTYRRSKETVVANFVDGVLVRYTISSN